MIGETELLESMDFGLGDRYQAQTGNQFNKIPEVCVESPEVWYGRDS